MWMSVKEESLKIQNMTQKRFCKDCLYYLYIRPRTDWRYIVREQFVCTRNRITITTPNLITGSESKTTGEFLDCKIERSDNSINNCGISGRYWKLHPHWQPQDTIAEYTSGV